VNMVPVDPHGRNNDTMARDLLNTIRGRQIELFKDDLLIRDLRRLSIVESKSQLNQYRLQAPSDEFGHVDRAIALALALPTALLVTQEVVDEGNESDEHIIQA